jgi:hypothetical protein
MSAATDSIRVATQGLKTKTDANDPVDVQIGIDALTSALVLAFPAIASYAVRWALPVVLRRLQARYQNLDSSVIKSAEIASELARQNLYTGQLKTRDSALVRQNIDALATKLEEFLKKLPQNEDEPARIDTE